MNVTTLILLRLIARNSTAALSPQKKGFSGEGVAVHRLHDQ